MNDVRTQRDRNTYLDRVIDNGTPAENDCSVSLLVVTTQVDTYPTSLNQYIAANPVVVDGNEIEGNAATYSADTTTTLFIENVGTQIPPNGTRMVAHLVGGRYTVRYDG